MPQAVMTPKVDALTGVTMVIDHAEHDIHDGNSFTTHFENTATGIGKVTAIGFRTPDFAVLGQSEKMHLTVDVQADDESLFEIDEAPTIDNDAGSNLVTLNRNRTSANVTLARRVINIEPGGTGFITSYDDVEFAAANYVAGTILLSEAVGAAGNPVSFTAGTNRGSREFILADNTLYIILLTTLTGNATVHRITANWSEEEGGDFAN